jgi:TATA-box binding protein (TBP) (component of TFIID and TFIIIB)
MKKYALFGNGKLVVTCGKKSRNAEDPFNGMRVKTRMILFDFPQDDGYFI